MTKFGLPVFRSRSPEDSVDQMMIICHQLEKEGRNTGNVSPFRSRKYTGKNRRRQQHFILQGLPGIGPGRAQALLEKFGTVRKVFAASESEWIKVPGIGKETARQIGELLD